jgi:hypothetical protein
MIKTKLKKRIHSYMFINERIPQIRCKLKTGYLKLIAVYASKEGKFEQTEEIYENLQDQVNKINKNDYIIVSGDYNTRVGKNPIPGIIGTNGEITVNNNGPNI